MFQKITSKLAVGAYKVFSFLNNLSKKAPAEKVLFKPYTLNYSVGNTTKKIIHINGNFIVGGSSQLIVDIIERTSDKYKHIVIVPDAPNPVPYQPVDIYAFSINELSGLYDFLKETKPDLVHIHYWVRHIHRFEGYALWYQSIFRICEELNIKILQNINVPTKPFNNANVLHNVFVSKYVMDNFNDRDTAASVIYPGSNFSHFKNDDIEALPDDSIGMVYRLDKDKLNEKAIEIFIAAVKKKRTLKCFIVGDGDYLMCYKKRVQEENLEPNFIFTGMVSYADLPSFYKKMSIFVAPVHDESFGQVSPFAMSMGLVVAGYDTGALSEILGSKETLVEYGDINNLAELIIELSNDKEKRVMKGRQNQLRTHNMFTVEKMIADYLVLYNDLIK
jgi:glycosyltransferase involved in cell wall biosynthesis